MPDWGAGSRYAHKLVEDTVGWNQRYQLQEMETRMSATIRQKLDLVFLIWIMTFRSRNWLRSADTSFQAFCSVAPNNPIMPTRRLCLCGVNGDGVRDRASICNCNSSQRMQLANTD